MKEVTLGKIRRQIESVNQSLNIFRYQGETDLDSEHDVLTVVLVILMILIPLLIIAIFLSILFRTCWRVYRRSERKKLMIAASYDVDSDAESWNTDFSEL